VKRVLGAKKSGHTGTLDPMATGVLVVMLGGATRFIDFLHTHDKAYEATVRMGITTDTLDIEGTVLTETKTNITAEEFEKTMLSFLGEIDQIPPMYSAIKVNGKKMYELARKGIEVERKPRIITIYDIEILDITLPFVTILVTCSKGTYIRTLCQDIGEKIGCGGYMKSLVRTKNGRFSIEDSLSLEEFEEKWKEEKFSEILISPTEFE
jgi:tRNA pseudouridine55 synthase